MTTTPQTPSAGPWLSIDTVPAAAWTVVELGGELDLATAPILSERVEVLIDQERPPRIALDLAGVAFCDSSGVNAFIRLWKQAHAAAGELVLLRPGARLAVLLTRTGVDRLLQVRETLPEPPPA